jgi:hypothetical protein
MDLASLFQLCRRHLVVLFLACVLGGAFVTMVVVTAPPVYRASGSNVLLPPQPAPDLTELVPTESENLYVRLGDPSLVVDIVERRMETAASAAQVKESGFDGDYSVTGNSESRRGPILELTATALTETAALDGLAVLLDQQAAVLADMQAGTPDEQLITSTIVVAPSADPRPIDAGTVFDASSTVVLVDPTPQAAVQVPVEQTANPYFRLNDMSVVVDIIKRVMVGADVDQRVRADGLTGTYLVAANTDFYRGPIIDMVVESDNPDAAVAGVKLLLVEQALVLDEIQSTEGTDPDYRITTQVVVEPAEASRVLSSTMRRGLAAAILAGGFVLASLLLADLVRRLRARRALRRGGKSDPDQVPVVPQSGQVESGQVEFIDDDIAFHELDFASAPTGAQTQRPDPDADDDRAHARSTVGT